MEKQSDNNNEYHNLLEKLQGIGILAETGNDVFQLITDLEDQIKHLKEDIEGTYDKKKSAEKEIHSLMLQDVENRRKISDLEDALRSHKDKEPKYESTSFRRSSVDYSQFKATIESLEKERDQLKQKISKLEQNALDFFNTEVSFKETESKLREENTLFKKTLETLRQKKEDGNSEVYLQDELANRQKTPLEEVQNLRTELEKIKRENKRLKEMNADFKDEILLLKNTQEVIMNQKDAECSLRLDQIDTLKKEKTSLMDQLDEKVKEIHYLKEGSNKGDVNLYKDYEQLQIANKYLEDELKNIRIQVDVLRSQRERLKLETDSLYKEIENKNVIIEESQKVNEYEEATGTGIAEPQGNTPKFGNAFDITILKVDVGDKEKRFGIKMTSKPSRVVITEVAEKQIGIKRGDYVLKINNVNMQGSDMSDGLRDLGTSDSLNMTIVRPKDCFQEHHISNQPNCVGVKLCLTVTKLSNAAKKSDIRLGDEIVKINGHNINDLSLSKIQHKLGRSSVELSVRRTVDDTEVVSPTSSTTYESIETVKRDMSKLSVQPTKSKSNVSSTKTSSTSHSSSSHENEDSVFRRSPTASTDAGKAFRNSVTSQDIIVGEKIFIRNNDTDDSGDSLVAIQHDNILNSTEPEYVVMSDTTSTRQESEERGPQLPTIPESPLLSQNGETRSTSSGSTRQEDVASQRSGMEGRPPHPLPDSSPVGHGTYQYVDRKFSPTRGYQREITLRKNVNVPSFGFTIFGGNKVGIYVDHVEKWQPAEQEGLQEGSRILSMNGVEVTDSVFCFAAEYLKRLSHTEKLKMVVMNMPEKEIAIVRSKVPYDWFSVKARKDPPQVPGCTLQFKKGDVLQIKDSYKDFDPNTGGYKWFAVKAIGGGVYSQLREGTVPAEQSSIYKMNEDYPEEEFDSAVDSKAKKKKMSFLKPWMRKSESSDKFEENSVFPYEELYEYLEDVKT